MKNCIGWDVGGAHLKAVLVNGAGHVLAAKQVYCPLWLGLNQLEAAIVQVQAEFNAEQHAVTMTGELADIFDNRQQGVMQIAQLLSGKLQGNIRYFAGKHQFVEISMVAEYWADIASMNWLASLQLAAQHANRAMFVDIGSTTTDIALIDATVPVVQGFTDAMRMQCDELVYSGVVRTPLMAVAQKIKVGNKLAHVAAEYFATTADIYTLTDELSFDDNIATTADGADKSVISCARRIARMVGHDVSDAPLASWHDLALQFRQIQITQIKTAMQNQLARLSNTSQLQIIGAGVGSFLVAEIAKALGHDYVDARQFIYADNVAIKKVAEVCFPAYAVAFLALNHAKVRA